MNYILAALFAFILMKLWSQHQHIQTLQKVMGAVLYSQQQIVLAYRAEHLKSAQPEPTETPDA